MQLGEWVGRGGLTRLSGGAWRVLTTHVGRNGDLTLELARADRVVLSRSYGALRGVATKLPVPEDVEARVGAVLAALPDDPRGDDVARALLDALVPTAGHASLVARVTDVIRLRDLAVDGGRVRFSSRVVVDVGWHTYGALSVEAYVDLDTDDGPLVTRGPMRLGSLGSVGHRLGVPEGVDGLLDVWHAALRARLARLVQERDLGVVVVPWLVQPAMPLGDILARWAVDGPPVVTVPALFPAEGSVARAAAVLARGEPHGSTGRSWVLGSFVVRVDPAAGSVTLEQGPCRVQLLATHPWEPGLRGGLDTDAPSTITLVRWLREVILAAGLDAHVDWIARDPEGPGALGEGPATVRVTDFLALRGPDEDLEPVVDARVQGAPVGSVPWHAWEGCEGMSAEALAAACALRDQFVSAWVCGPDSVPASR